MPANKHRAEILVGLFVIFGAVLIAWLIFQFGHFRENPRKGYLLIVEVNDATGIRSGVPVRLGGVDIGRVSADPVLGSDFSSLTISLRIFDGIRVPVGSRVKVGTSGLMGDSYVRIIPPEVPDGEFLPEGHKIAAEVGGSFTDLAGTAEIALEEVVEAADEITAAADRMESLFIKLEEGLVTDENVTNVRILLAELKASSEYIHAASRKLDPLLDETGAALGDVREVASQTKEAIVGIDEGMSALTDTLSAMHPVLTEFDRSLDSLRATLNSANRLINTIEKGDGLASALLKDSKLKRDLESFIDKLNRNGVLLYPREGGILRNNLESQSNSPLSPAPGAEKRPFSGIKPRP